MTFLIVLLNKSVTQSLKYLLYFSSLLLFGSCMESLSSEETGEIMAKVYNRNLYSSDVTAMIPPNVTRQDSFKMVNAFIDRWIRDELMLFEASRYLPEDLNIEKLVDAYRTSLILNNYEKLLVETELDSTFSKTELKHYHKENEAQFILLEPAIRCRMATFKKDHPEKKPFQEMWDDPDINSSDLLTFARPSAEQYLLNDSSWYKKSEIVGALPAKASTLKSGKRQTFDDQNRRYYIEVLEEIEEGNVAPFGMVKDQIKKVLTHQRKTDIVFKKKKELYERERKRNNIKIYFK